MPHARRRAAFAACAAAAFLCIAPSGGAATRSAQTKAQLAAVKAEIASIHAKASRDEAKSRELTRELRKAELSLTAARQALTQLESARAERASRRAQLAAQKRELESKLASERVALAGELRAAYRIGRSEPLELLLDQQDPARLGRMLAYYGYFGRARAAQIGEVNADVKQLGVLDAKLASEEQHLTQLAAQQSAALGQLESARSARQQTLASLEARSRTRAQRLARLQRQRAGLESLLRRLRRAAAAPQGKDAFSRLRGRLAWPVAGRIAARFGETRAGGLKWDGVLIDTQRGAQVHAIDRGRVIFANWLPGLGLLMIIDHGGGYLSLYGHNERLYKKVGDEVATGDIIAAAGETGGSERPELYFEIRKGDRAIDPGPWFKSAEPGR